jgi:hypothetical protein
MSEQEEILDLIQDLNNKGYKVSFKSYDRAFGTGCRITCRTKDKLKPDFKNDTTWSPKDIKEVLKSSLSLTE